MAFFVERLQRGLGIAARSGDGGFAFVAQRVALRQRACRARIEQFVEQQRMRGQALGKQRAARNRIDQPSQCFGLFVEQGQIAAAAQDVLQQRQHAPQRGFGLARSRGRLQQRRHHAVEPGARRIRQVAHAGRAHEIAQLASSALRFVEPGIGQYRRLARLGQGAPVRGERARFRAAPARGQQRFEFRGDARAMRIELFAQRRPVGESAADREPLPVDRRFPATHASARREASAGGSPGGAGSDRPAPAQSPTSGAICRASTSACSAGINCRCCSAVSRPPRISCRACARNSISRMPPGPRLMSSASSLRATSAAIAAFISRRPCERAVIEITAIDERPQRLQQAFAGIEVAGHRARLQPGVALPVAPFALEILLHRGERQRHAAGVAERTQPQVDAVAEAVDRGLVEQLGELLAEPREIIFRMQRRARRRCRRFPRRRRPDRCRN